MLCLNALVNQTRAAHPLANRRPPDTFIQKTKKLFQDSRSARNLAKINDDLAEVHSIMTRNIAEVLGQGEQLDGARAHGGGGFGGVRGAVCSSPGKGSCVWAAGTHQRVGHRMLPRHNCTHTHTHITVHAHRHVQAVEHARVRVQELCRALQGPA